MQCALFPLSKYHSLIHPEPQHLVNGSHYAKGKQLVLTPGWYYAYEAIICSF